MIYVNKYIKYKYYFFPSLEYCRLYVRCMCIFKLYQWKMVALCSLILLMSFFTADYALCLYFSVCHLLSFIKFWLFGYSVLLFLDAF